MSDLINFSFSGLKSFNTSVEYSRNLAIVEDYLFNNISGKYSKKNYYKKSSKHIYIFLLTIKIM